VVTLKLADEPVVTHAVFPEFPEQRAVQGLSDAYQRGERGRNGDGTERGTERGQPELRAFCKTASSNTIRRGF